MGERDPFTNDIDFGTREGSKSSAMAEVIEALRGQGSLLADKLDGLSGEQAHELDQAMNRVGRELGIFATLTNFPEDVEAVAPLLEKLKETTDSAEQKEVVKKIAKVLA